MPTSEQRPRTLPPPRPPRTPVGAKFVYAFFALLIVFLVALLTGVVSSVYNDWERSKLGPLHLAACDGDVARCERLVKDGVPVDTPDDQGVTALSWAVYYCKPDAVRKLIELGADVNHAGRRGLTPLMYTSFPLRGQNLRGTQGQRNEIARLLIEHGADVNHAMGDGRASGRGQTTLHFAASTKNADLVRMLLAAGANPNVKSNQGYTPLDVAKFPDNAPNDAVIEALQQSAQKKGTFLYFAPYVLPRRSDSPPPRRFRCEPRVRDWIARALLAGGAGRGPGSNRDRDGVLATPDKRRR